MADGLMEELRRKYPTASPDRLLAMYEAEMAKRAAAAAAPPPEVAPTTPTVAPPPTTTIPTTTKAPTVAPSLAPGPAKASSLTPKPATTLQSPSTLPTWLQAATPTWIKQYPSPWETAPAPTIPTVTEPIFTSGMTVDQAANALAARRGISVGDARAQITRYPEYYGVTTGATEGGANVPKPGEEEEDKFSRPFFEEINGQLVFWNPTGGMYGGGGYELVGPVGTTGAMGLTAEQQIAQAEEDRRAQQELLQMQFGYEQQLDRLQAQWMREQQAASAAQQMAQMYAADPYKYWAQLGMGTPGAVARLTGGQVSPGQPFQQGVPLSTPSAQWWQNLLPSEQQQIAGGLNWLGINPEDWYSMYQRMIPGLGARQLEPMWAR